MIAAVETAIATPVLDERGFLAWIDRAAPGDRITYHEGHLGCDRAPRISPFAEPARCELDRVAGLAMTLADNGHLLLAQGRVAEDRVAYFAIMATRQAAKGGRR